MTPEIWFPHFFNLQFEKINKAAFSIFGFNIYWYGILLGLGVMLGGITAFRLAKVTGQNLNNYYDFTFLAVITSIIGARLYYVVFNWDYYIANPLEIFNSRSGGLAIYGVIIAAVITAVIFARVKKIPFFRLADTCAPGLALGQAIGRWGNFVNKEAFGEYTDGLFAMRLQASQVAQGSITEKMLEHKSTFGTAVEYIQVHPTFLYESVLCFCIFILLYFYVKHKKFEGEIFYLYFVFYGTGRFFIEGIRTDQLFLWGTRIPVSQLVSAIAAILALGAIIYKFYWLKKEKNKVQEVN